MNTIDENGNVVSGDGSIPISAEVLQKIGSHINVVRQLGSLHTQLSAVPINTRSVVTAVGLLALLGGAYFLNQRNDAESDEYEGDDNE